MGGRLPDNAWRVDWFLAIPRNANKDAGIGTAHAAKRALPPTPCREPSPGLVAALKPRAARRRNPFAARTLAVADLPLASSSAALCTNRSAADEPNRGLTRLMRTGIVGSNPCGVIRDISSAAAARSSPSRFSSLVLKFPPPPLRRRSLRSEERRVGKECRDRVC